MTKGRMFRWIVSVGGAALLLQAGTCNLSDPQVLAQFRDQLLVPALGSLFSDAIFFTLDNALVHLTT
jgi:hypothetical protein